MKKYEDIQVGGCLLHTWSFSRRLPSSPHVPGPVKNAECHFPRGLTGIARRKCTNLTGNIDKKL